MQIQKKRKESDDRGMAIVLVIVTIGMATLLVSVLMTISLLNYQMKATEKQSKDNFYSAEVVLDQIHAGLQQEISNAASIAYGKAMQTYGVVSEEVRVNTFKATYVYTIRDNISLAGRDDFYYVGGVDGELNGDSLYTKGLAKYLDKTLAGKVKDGSLVISSTEGDNKKEGLLESKPTKLILKKLMVQYTDDNGYYTEIQTDIAIGNPDITLKEAAVLPNIFDFALIADKGLVTKGTKNIIVEQSVYAGTEGVQLTEDSDVSFEDAKYLVTSGKVEVDFSSELAMSGGELWAKGIDVSGSSSAGSGSTHRALQLDTTAYVADDLTISDRNSEVLLQGSYYGYGSPEAITGDESTIAARSSAIIMNSSNSTLNMIGLENLWLCGNAYLNGQNINYTISDDFLAGNNISKNILLGNSLSVKSDQIAYLVPAECLGTVTAAGTSSSTVLVGKNPMSEEEYKTWSQTFVNRYLSDSANDYQQMDVNKTVSLLGKSLSEYGITGTDFQTIFRTVNGENICYVYLKLDADTASSYFKAYSQAADQKMTQYAQKYHNTIYLNDNYTDRNTRGNVFTCSYNQDNTISFNYLDSTLTDTTAAQQAETQQKYANSFKALCSKLTVNYAGLTSAELSKSVFKNLIKEEALPSGTKTYEVNGYKAMVSSDALIKISPSSKVKLVITSGDVEVSESFSGVILAGGTVTLTESNAAKITSDKENVTRLLNTKVAEEDGGKSLVETYFVNGERYAADSTGNTNTVYADFEQLITFENWTKQ